jgi:uncharacterized HAD superfamily protein
MKLNVAFDLDCVLVDLIAQIESYLANDGYQLKDINKYDMVSAIEPEITEERLWQYFMRCYEKYEETPICGGAAQLLEILHAKSQDPILIVTHRPTWSASHTHALVQKFIDVPYVIAFADKRHGKGSYLNNVDYFVEDRRKTAMELAARGKKVFMPKWAWNQMPANQNIVKIDSIMDLLSWTDHLVK